MRWDSDNGQDHYLNFRRYGAQLEIVWFPFGKTYRVSFMGHTLTEQFSELTEAKTAGIKLAENVLKMLQGDLAHFKLQENL